MFPNEASEMESKFDKAGIDTHTRSTNETRNESRNQSETKIISKYSI